MRVGLFVTGAIILVLGLLIVVNYQYAVSAAESIFGGWAMLSEVHQERVAYLYMGYMIVVIGIIIMIPSLILNKKSEDKSKPSGYVCGHCNFIGKTEEELWNHYNDKHPDKRKW